MNTQEEEMNINEILEIERLAKLEVLNRVLMEAKHTDKDIEEVIKDRIKALTALNKQE